MSSPRPETPATVLERNKALIRDNLRDVWNGHDLSKIDVYYASDFRSHDPAVQPGREFFKAALAKVFAIFPDFSGVLDLALADGDRVATITTWKGTQQGEAFGQRPSGRRVEYQSADVFRIVDDQIAEHWHVVDRLTMLRQLGVIDV